MKTLLTVMAIFALIVSAPAADKKECTTCCKDKCAKCCKGDCGSCCK